MDGEPEADSYDIEGAVSEYVVACGDEKSYRRHVFGFADSSYRVSTFLASSDSSVGYFDRRASVPAVVWLAFVRRKDFL